MNEKLKKTGQFLPGQSPGPGRGKKKDKYPEADNIEAFKKMMEPKVRRVIADLVNSTDPKVKRDGAKLYISLYGVESYGKREALNPVMLDVLRRYFFEDEPELDSGKTEGLKQIKKKEV